ncbi:phosphopantothenoylcysteine decarboxylase/phosphopantothenate-cysteine ligase [Propionibacterium ruminifibrarum]|uniref:Coenzyme A biosynthesis bifunctional protein CoaBC n=1 Tax=Propionibacterium ruminifibrarum TaxID=1962131 RepID=A0A375I3L7_9ACTN|nr:bifunctional phosphopantothenoylcysteine decarboxylase/phosphopantothenate synthase [Propionibacterium ruminifibrarum]SPF69439.1 phosphopantothenoylcysteine decarboxylase/phosphopantothenate-cysteine ligase [Propionibacterium ruminifibrarum]
MAEDKGAAHEAGRPTVLLGISASIAAFKAAGLASALTKAGVAVQAVMTPRATDFIAPLTLEALTGNPCPVENIPTGSGSAMEHIDLARAADLVLVAPASADVIGRIANGLADDLLTTTILACTCPVLIAPAMNTHMFANPAVQANLTRLTGLGYEVLAPDSGLLACGDIGPGRMPDEQVLVARVLKRLGLAADAAEPAADDGGAAQLQPVELADGEPATDRATGDGGADHPDPTGGEVLSPADGTDRGGESADRRPDAPAPPTADPAEALSEPGLPPQGPGDLAGLRVLVTAGATIERIDPVRYITNHSTGRMGFALAQAARDRGAHVTLVAADTASPPPAVDHVERVESAEQMFQAVARQAQETDVIIMAAAVADYRPRHIADQKIKKGDGPAVLELERTRDILAWLGEHRRPGQTLCGFSMETTDLVENSRRKLERKGLDLIVANDLSTPGAGFGGDTNIVTIITPEAQTQLPLASKRDVADQVLSAIVQARSGH